MGDTFGAWICTMPDGKKHMIVCKAYSLARSIADRRYPNYNQLNLVAKAINGEVVVRGDDNIESL